MREKLLEVIFDENGRLRTDRLENLLDVVGQDQAALTAALLPLQEQDCVYFPRRWLDLRSRLLLTLIRDERLHVDDLRHCWLWSNAADPAPCRWPAERLNPGSCLGFLPLGSPPLIP